LSRCHPLAPFERPRYAGGMTGTFPATRLRRTRSASWSRALHGETVLTPADLIWPLFISAGDCEEPIATLPGVSRWSIPQIVDRAKEARGLGIPCVALFPNTPRELRTDDGAEALNPDNLMCRATRAIKDALGDEIGVLTDVALDPYTAHGHDGLVNGNGYVLNDATSAALVKQALNQAKAGADIIAPS
jgi:porphobilinogen synthase